MHNQFNSKSAVSARFRGLRVCARVQVSLCSCSVYTQALLLTTHFDFRAVCSLQEPLKQRRASSRRLALPHHAHDEDGRNNHGASGNRTPHAVVVTERGGCSDGVFAFAELPHHIGKVVFCWGPRVGLPSALLTDKCCEIKKLHAGGTKRHSYECVRSHPPLQRQDSIRPPLTSPLDQCGSWWCYTSRTGVCEPGL